MKVRADEGSILAGSDAESDRVRDSAGVRTIPESWRRNPLCVYVSRAGRGGEIENMHATLIGEGVRVKW